MLKFIKKLGIKGATIAIFFLLIQAFCDLYIPTLTAHMINEGVVGENIPAILKIGLVMLGFSAMSFVAALLNTYTSAKIAYKLGAKIRREVYQKTVSFSKVEIDYFGTSSLITRGTNDVTQMQLLIEMGLKFLIIAPLYLVGGIFLSYRLSPSLTTPYIVIVPIIFLITFVLFHFANPLFEKMQKNIDRLNLIFKEGLTGYKVIRAFNQESVEYNRYRLENEKYTKTAIKSNVLLIFLMPFVTFFVSLAAVIITWLGAGLIDTGTLQIGTLIGVAAYTTQILMGIALITNIISSIPRGRVSAKRINEVLDKPLEIKEGTLPMLENPTQELLSLKNVFFTYPHAEKAALENINFDVQKGETVAIIGSTGAGKTTLINLLNRFYLTNAGEIKFGQEAIQNIKKAELYRQISFVPQQNTLFFGTVRENLKMADPTASDQDILWAVAQANATDFLFEKQGLETLVEKNGANFSGGQRQRLCLARAFLKKSLLYIFDDSFSAIDFKTDSLIQKNLKTNFKPAAKIIVAQRIATVKNAHRILVLNKGRIVGFDSHDNLAKNNTIYQEIMASQTEEKAEYKHAND